MRADSDTVDLVTLARALIDIDSTTGREGEAGLWLADYLRGLVQERWKLRPQSP